MAKEHSTSGPKDFFLQLLATGSLFFSIVSFITLKFQFIEALFPDPLTYSFFSIIENIRWATSALIVVFPVFMFTSWLIAKEAAQEPEKRELRVRKWLVNFTLFIAAITAIVDFITIIYSYLGGDLTIQFFLKALTILIVASAVFAYYLWDLRRKVTKKSSTKLFAYIASGVVLASIIGGFFVVGSPATQRARKFDQQRINDLQMVRNQIDQYYSQKQELPQSLQDLATTFPGYITPQDPQTQQPYEYIPKNNLNFDLCATFTTKSPELNDESIARPYAIYGIEDWAHETGRTCFTRAINRNNFKPLPL